MLPWIAPELSCKTDSSRRPESDTLGTAGTLELDTQFADLTSAYHPEILLVKSQHVGVWRRNLQTDPVQAQPLCLTLVPSARGPLFIPSSKRENPLVDDHANKQRY